MVVLWKTLKTGRGHLVAVQVFCNPTVQLAFADFLMRDQVPRTRRQKSGRNDAFGGVVGQDIAGDLLAHKLGDRLVGIQAIDDIVTVGPRVGSRLVLVVAVGFGVAREIQPMLPPFFTEFSGV